MTRYDLIANMTNGIYSIGLMPDTEGEWVKYEEIVGELKIHNLTAAENEFAKICAVKALAKTEADLKSLRAFKANESEVRHKAIEECRVILATTDVSKFNYEWAYARICKLLEDCS